jgi:hypothetical protein
MSKEARLKDKDYQTIALVYEQFPINAKAEAVRQAASKLVGRDYGLSTIQRELKPLRKIRRDAEKTKRQGEPLKPIDKTWSIGSLAEYPCLVPITSELLLISKTIEPEGFLTNRLALWLYRLAYLWTWEEIKKFTVTDRDLWLSLAQVYQLYEYQWERSVKTLPVNTEPLDDIDPYKIAENILRWFEDRVEKSVYDRMKAKLQIKGGKSNGKSER